MVFIIVWAVVKSFIPISGDPANMVSRGTMITITVVSRAPFLDAFVASFIVRETPGGTISAAVIFYRALSR